MEVRIKTLESFVQGHIGLVRVTTDDGAQGWGQFAPYNADITATVFHRQVAPRALGQDPSDVEALVERIVEAEYKYPGSYVCRAVGGLDTALWDLLAKKAGKSVCAFLGGTPKDFVAYGSSMRRDIKPADEAARLKDLVASHGYRAFKIRIGKVCGHDEDEWPGRTDELVPTVRKALGPDVTVLVDGNSCYSPKKAIEVGRMLEANRIGHFEEPCPYWELEQTAQVAAALTMPVAGGEQDTDLAHFRRMIAMRAVDIVQPDVNYLGGLARSRRVALDAHAAGLPCVPHSANRSMVTVFTLHLMAVIPNPGPHVEFSIEPDHWADEIFTPVLTVKNGLIPFPTGPGWGVTVNPSWVAKAQRQVAGS
jgi:L-alanine-DL-glutamate epimerase-like enolase superfamily enzyme